MCVANEMSSSKQGQMPITEWTLVNTASTASPEGRAAFSTLAKGYWSPLYLYLRKKGHDIEEAQDLTQAFFVAVMDGQLLADAQRERGRFRSYILKALRHFVINEARKQSAARRAGDAEHLEFDFVLAEESYVKTLHDDLTPERILDIEWYAAFRRRAAERLRSTYEAQGHAERFDLLFPFLWEQPEPDEMTQLAEQLDAKRNTVAVWLKRLRSRWQDAALAEAESTCSNPEEAPHEILDMRLATQGRGRYLTHPQQRERKAK